MALLLTLAAPAHAAAQVSAGIRISNVAANAAIGGVVSGVRSLIRGKRSMKPVLLGAGGGALQALGRQVAANGGDGAGLLGREISAAGISLTHSAAIDSLVGLVPVGPLLLELRPRGADRVRLRVNAVDVVTIAYALADGRSDFDLGASLSLGAPVFERPLPTLSPELFRGGYTQVGTVFVAPETAGDERPLVLRHEAVHVLQWDAINLTVAAPAERALLARVPGGRRLSKFLDLGVVGAGLVFLVASAVEYDSQPWEREAYRLTTGRPTFRQ